VIDITEEKRKAGRPPVDDDNRYIYKKIGFLPSTLTDLSEIKKKEGVDVAVQVRIAVSEYLERKKNNK